MAGTQDPSDEQLNSVSREMYEILVGIWAVVDPESHWGKKIAALMLKVGE